MSTIELSNHSVSYQSCTLCGKLLSKSKNTARGFCQPGKRLAARSRIALYNEKNNAHEKENF